MNERAKDDLWFYGPFAVAGLFAVGGWLWAWLALRGVHGPLIIHFSDYSGINQIGGMGEVHGIGATGVVIAAANFFVARALRARDPRWAKGFGIATLFVCALLFTGLAAIISVNQ